MSKSSKFLLIGIMALILGLVSGKYFYQGGVFKASGVEAKDLTVPTFDVLPGESGCTANEDVIKCQSTPNVAIGNCHVVSGTSIIRLNDDKFNDTCTIEVNSKMYPVYLYKSFQIAGVGETVSLKGFPKLAEIVAAENNSIGQAVIYTSRIKYIYEDEIWTPTEVGEYQKTMTFPTDDFPACNTKTAFNNSVCVSGSKNSDPNIQAYWKTKDNTEYFLYQRTGGEYYLYAVNSMNWVSRFYKTHIISNEKIDFYVTYFLSSFKFSSFGDFAKSFFNLVYAEGVPPIINIQFGYLDSSTGKIIDWGEKYFKGVQQILEEEGTNSGKYKTKISFTSSQWSDLNYMNPKPNIWRIVPYNYQSESTSNVTSWISIGDNQIILDDNFQLTYPLLDEKKLKTFGEIFENQIGAALKNHVMSFNKNDKIKGAFNLFDTTMILSDSDLYYILKGQREPGELLIPIECKGSVLQILDENDEKATVFYPGFRGKVIYNHANADLGTINWEYSNEELEVTDSAPIVNNIKNIYILPTIDASKKQVIIKADGVFEGNSCIASKEMKLVDEFVSGTKEAHVFSQ